jgi:hypothetical protein
MPRSRTTGSDWAGSVFTQSSLTPPIRRGSARAVCASVATRIAASAAASLDEPTAAQPFVGVNCTQRAMVARASSLVQTTPLKRSAVLEPRPRKRSSTISVQT